MDLMYLKKRIKVRLVKNNDKCVAMVVRKKMPIEWMRFNMYIKDDIYRNVPMLVFRVKEFCSGDLIEKLMKCVRDFQGSVDWKVFKDPLSKRGNYLLTISELEGLHRKCYEEKIEYNQKKYFGMEVFMKYCECAVEDIPLLARHIDEKLHV